MTKWEESIAYRAVNALESIAQSLDRLTGVAPQEREVIADALQDVVERVRKNECPDCDYTQQVLEQQIERLRIQ